MLPPESSSMEGMFFTSHPREDADLLNECWPHPTLFLKLAPIRPFYKAG